MHSESLPRHAQCFQPYNRHGHRNHDSLIQDVSRSPAAILKSAGTLDAGIARPARNTGNGDEAQGVAPRAAHARRSVSRPYSLARLWRRGRRGRRRPLKCRDAGGKLFAHSHRDVRIGHSNGSAYADLKPDGELRTRRIAFTMGPMRRCLAGAAPQPAGGSSTTGGVYWRSAGIECASAGHKLFSSFADEAQRHEQAIAKLPVGLCHRVKLWRCPPECPPLRFDSGRRLA